MSDLQGMISEVLNDPDQMKKIMDMASSIMGGSGKEGGQEPAQQAAKEQKSPSSQGSSGSILSSLGIPGLSGLGSGIASAFKKLSKGDSSFSGDKTELLEALKPWLSENRRSKLERAMKLAKVMGVAGSAFLDIGG